VPLHSACRFDWLKSHGTLFGFFCRHPLLCGMSRAVSELSQASSQNAHARMLKAQVVDSNYMWPEDKSLIMY
jgi:hypothetical protein